MALVGLVQRRPLHESNGVFEAMLELAETPAGIHEVWDVYQRTVSVLLSRFPHLYVLTNIRTASDPQPRWYSWPAYLDPHLLAQRPNARLDLDYFSRSLPRRDQLAYLIQFETEELSSLCNELLGAVPPPAHADLMFAGEGGLCEWVARTTAACRDREAWESRMLDRFAVVFHVHEAYRFLLRTKQRAALEFLRPGPQEPA